VFALVNLPEVVKGALFAAYSRSAKSLRRLFLDEFVGDLDISGDSPFDATVGLAAAEELYERCFFEYGDDSVAQLGGVTSRASRPRNILTEGARVGPADELPRAEHALHPVRRAARWSLPLLPRPRRAGEPLRHPLRRRHGPACSTATACCSTGSPTTSRDRDANPRQRLRLRRRPAKALDACAAVLPAPPCQRRHLRQRQAFEALLLRMRAHPLPEAGSTPT
jgi:hypothetical protein